MTQREKLVERIRARPTEANYQEVRQLLEMDGWTLRNSRGSHFTFKKPGELPIVIVTHGGKVKRGYLDLLCKRLGLDDES